MRQILKTIKDNKREALYILAAVLLSYGVTASYGFVMDDYGLVAGNPNVKSLGRVFHVFASGYWDSEGYSRGFYRPLDILSYMAEYAAFGARPFIYHADNVLLHFAASVLVYFLAAALLGGGRAPLFAALIFAVHPVHVEAVAWISSRGELLSAVFSLAALLFFIHRRREKAFPYLAYLFFFLALLSKESAAVLPILLALYMLVFEPQGRGGRIGYLVRPLYPFAAVFAVFLAVRLSVLGILSPSGIDQAFHGLGPHERLLTMLRALYEYVRLGLLPFDLRPDYFFPPPGSLLDARALLPLAALALFILSAKKALACSRPGFFAVSWFFLALLPVMNIIPANIIMAERVMYMPSIGLCILLGMAAEGVSSSCQSPRVGPLLVLPVAALLLVLTLQRDRVWHDQDGYAQSYVRMLDEGIARHPGYAPLYKLKARMLTRFFPFGPEVEKAVFEASRRAGPDDFEAHSMLAWVYYCKAMPDKALSEVEATLRVFPNANYYNFAGTILLQLGRLDDALEKVDTALRLNPQKAEFYMNKGNILMEKGEDDEALGQFEAAARLDPDNHDALLEQGVILDSKREFAAAIEKIKKAVGLRPDIPDLHYFLAVAYVDAGRPDMAGPELKAALALRPGYKEASDLLRRISAGR